MQRRSDTARLFFALWPDDRVRTALAALAREYCAECSGRVVPAANLHLTLAFLGDVKSRSFQLSIDTRGYWRHNRVVWAGAAQCPAALRGLLVKLADLMRANGFRHEAREYVPHVTLLRDSRRAPTIPVPAPIAWDVDDFALMRSAQRGRSSGYDIVHRWPFERH